MLCYNVVETDVPRTVQWYGFRENFSIVGDMHTHIHDFLGVGSTASLPGWLCYSNARYVRTEENESVRELRIAGRGHKRGR